MSYEILWKPNGVIKRYFSHVTNGELLRTVMETESDHRFDTLRYVINDFLGCNEYSVDETVDETIVEDISVLDWGAAKTNQNIKIAVVTAAPEIIAIATEYANSPINAYPTRIFPILTEARAWLEKQGCPDRSLSHNHA